MICIEPFLFLSLSFVREQAYGLNLCGLRSKLSQGRQTELITVNPACKGHRLEIPKRGVSELGTNKAKSSSKPNSCTSLMFSRFIS